MKCGTRRMIGAVAGTAAVWLLSVALVGGQTAPARNQMLSEEYFENVTVLTGISVDEFMGTMGVFSAALGLSCENCHTASSDDWALYANETPFKETARRMVRMMAAINEEKLRRKAGGDLLHVPSRQHRKAARHVEPESSVRRAATR